MSLFGLESRDDPPGDVTLTADRFNNSSDKTLAVYSAGTTGLPLTDHHVLTTEGASTTTHNVSLADVLRVMWNETSESYYNVNTGTQGNDSNAFFITQLPDGNISSESFRTSYDNGNLSDIGSSSSADLSNLSLSLNISLSWFWQYFDTTGAVTDLSVKERPTAHSDIDTFTAIDLSPLITLITSPNPRIDGLGEPYVLSWDVVLKVVVLAIISIVGFLGNVRAIWSVVKESHLHRPPFYFLLSLGVTDLSRAVFCLPVVITTVLHGDKWRGSLTRLGFPIGEFGKIKVPPGARQPHGLPT
ncbi:hypothetical protein Btru_018795 [Bulinus truncatus]|nr:hypothetical protein Btru_018795 [Bulinus truncatus]